MTKSNQLDHSTSPTTLGGPLSHIYLHGTQLNKNGLVQIVQFKQLHLMITIHNHLMRGIHNRWLNILVQVFISHGLDSMAMVTKKCNSLLTMFCSLFCQKRINQQNIRYLRKETPTFLIFLYFALSFQIPNTKKITFQ